MSKKAKTELKFYYLSTLPPNFQLNILIFFMAKASLWTLFQSLKQKARKSVLSGWRIFGKIFQTFLYQQIRQNSITVTHSYAQYEFSAQKLDFWGQGKPSNFILVIEEKRQKVGQVGKIS